MHRLTDLDAVDHTPPSTSEYTSEGELRKIKRKIAGNATALQEVPLATLVRVIRTLGSTLYASARDRKHIAELQDYSLSDVHEECDRIREWCSNIDKYLEYLKLEIGEYLEESVSLQSSRRQIYRPGPPVVAILPGNSFVEAPHVIVQALLARVPILLRPSTRGAGGFPANCVIKALDETLKSFPKKLRDVILSTVNIVNLQAERDIATLVRRLWIANATVVIFGSESTVQSVDKEVCTLKGRVIGFGNGLATAVICKCADLDHAIEQVIEGAQFHKGRECISTKVLYIEDTVYNHVLKQLERLSVDVSLIERPHSISPTEDPRPVIHLYRVQSTEELLKLMHSHLAANRMTKNIVTSIFSSSVVQGLKIPTYTLKHNMATSSVDLFDDHQGVSLLTAFSERVSVRTVPRFCKRMVNA